MWECQPFLCSLRARCVRHLFRVGPFPRTVAPVVSVTKANWVWGGNGEAAGESVITMRNESGNDELKAITTRLCLGTSQSANGKVYEFMKSAAQPGGPGQVQVRLKLEASEKE